MSPDGLFQAAGSIALLGWIALLMAPRPALARAGKSPPSVDRLFPRCTFGFGAYYTIASRRYAVEAEAVFRF